MCMFGHEQDIINPQRKLAWWEKVLDKVNDFCNFMQEHEQDWWMYALFIGILILFGAAVIYFSVLRHL